MSTASSSRNRSVAVRYLIGVDGGGSGTRTRVARIGGNALASGQAGPSALGQGATQAWRNIVSSIDQAFHAAKLTDWQPRECAIGLGLAGAIVETRIDEFLRLRPDFGCIALASDAYTTLLGAHRGRPGAVVASGTGSVGEVLRADGTRSSVGGWGFPVGDEGSGAWLGLQAMRRAQHAIEGRAPSSPLVRAVWSAAGDTRAALLRWCERAGQREYAALAPLVFDAGATDPWAAQLLDDAARALAEIAMALDPAGALPLVVSGSVGQRLVPRLAAPLRARIVEAAGDAIDGALELVQRQLDTVETTNGR